MALVVFVVLTRLLTPDEIGVASMAYVVLALGNSLIDQGLTAAIVQRPSLAPLHLNAAFWWSGFLGLALTVGLVALAPGIAAVFQEPRLAAVLVGMSPVLVLGGLRNTQAAVLQREFRFDALAARTLAGEVFGGLVGIVMALAGLGVWSLVGQSVGRALSSTLVLWRASPWRPGRQLSLAHLRELLRFGTPVMGERLLGFLKGKFDDLLVGAVLGATLLGYYSVGYRLLNFVTELIRGTIEPVVLSTFSRMQTRAEPLRKAFETLNEYHALVGFPVFLGAVLAAPRFVPLVFGPQWSASIPVMQILGIVGLLRVVRAGQEILLPAVGRPGWGFALNLAEVALLVAGMLAAVSAGIQAVALVHLAVSLVFVLPGIAVVTRLIEIRPVGFFRPFLSAAAGSAGLVAAYWAASRTPFAAENTWAALSTLIVWSAAAYILLTRLLFPDVVSRVWRWMFEALGAPPSPHAHGHEAE